MDETKEIRQAYRALLAEHVPEMEHDKYLTLWDAVEATAAHHGEHHEREEGLKKRLAEMAEMLNKAADEARLQVDSERDACARAIQFLIDTREQAIQNEDLDYEHGADADHMAGLKASLHAVEKRKDPAVQWIDEMANGSKLGEFISEHVDKGVEQGISEWQGRLRGAAEKAVDLLDAYPAGSSEDQKQRAVDASGTLRGALDRENQQG